MDDVAEALERLAARPVFEGSLALGYLDCEEVGEAAVYLAEDVAERRVSLTADEKEVIIEGLEEYARGDRAVLEAYSSLLNPENWK